MPWDAHSFQKKNHSLSTAEAGKAAHQANAILEKTGDEGLAIATADKHAGESRASKLYGHKAVKHGG